MSDAEMPEENEFDGEFWNDDFRLKESDVPGPLTVAKMTQTNAYKRLDTRRFNTNAEAIADDFVALMTKIKLSRFSKT